ncbi:hypothetical protein HAX54_028194 [Datura stramonium]|uniref:Uncharacterized protein n=1 Tax=Datura stramonium TaxID=4076 RepID=A0ABS8V5Y1_DATST|nr:hypothetical protein [Datura stramonium]
MLATATDAAHIVGTRTAAPRTQPLPKPSHCSRLPCSVCICRRRTSTSPRLAPPRLPPGAWQLASCPSVTSTATADSAPHNVFKFVGVSDIGSIDNSLDTQTGDTKKRKEMQPRSGVWPHFVKVVGNGIGRAMQVL